LAKKKIYFYFFIMTTLSATRKSIAVSK